jgi:outer membrane protein assembly factor BamA
MYDSDIGLGLGVKSILKNNYRKQESLDLIIFASSKGEQWYAFQFSIPDFEYRQGEKYHIAFDIKIEWNKRLKSNYFGIGNDTEDNDFQFPREFFKTDMTVGHAFSQTMIVEAGYKFSYYTAYNYDPSWGTITSSTPGAQPNNVSNLNAGIRYDTRDSYINPTKGTRIHLKTSLSQKFLLSDWNFISYRLETSAYKNLWKKKHILAGRLWAQHIDGTAPFQELSKIGDGWTARGYKADRFLDKAMILTSGEFRFFLFYKFGGVVFYDTGQVTPQITSIDVKKWHTNWGWGFRYYLSTFIARFDMGISNEGNRIFFNFNHVF